MHGKMHDDEPSEPNAAMNGPDPASLLAESAWLRRLARELVGAAAADDLAQDVLVAALEQRPEVRTGLRPWLGTVARRLALLRRRRDVRRQRREQGAARQEAVTATADVVERAQLHRLVVEATLVLDEPYRTTLLLHYFDDLSMREVAQRCGVPLETARTRLRRGLATLRARLDRQCGGRRAWAVPLAAFFGEQARALVAVGGVLMTMQTKLLIGGIGVILAALLVWFAVPQQPPSETLPVTDAPPLAQAVAPPGGEATTAAAAAGAGNATTERTAAPMSDLLLIRGRCIASEDGTPLPGCRVELLVFPDAKEIALAGDRDADVSVTTGSDGCFELQWPLAQPSRLHLRVDAAHRGRVGREWSRSTAGELDCGDVPLTPGAILRGRSVDEGGLPVGGVRLLWSLRDRADWRVETAAVSSASDGTLHCDQVLVAGTWHLACTSGHRLMNPQLVEVAPASAAITLDVLVRRAEDLPAISGTVVDSHGAPVANMRLYASGDGPQLLTAATRADGSFMFRNTHGRAEPVRVRAGRGFRLVDAQTTYPWGTHDIRLVVLRPAVARIAVVDAQGAPVTRFAARVQSVDGSQVRRLSIEEVRRRLEGHVLRLSDLPPDRYRIAVLPSDASCGCTAPVDWNLVDGAELRIALTEPVPLRVTVQLPDGTPVAGSQVQLLRSEHGTELRLGCRTMTVQETYSSRQPGPHDGVVVDAAVTGADGSVVLRGVGGEIVAVRALGPGHAPVIRHGIASRPGGAVLVLQVAQGAAIRGRLFPQRVLEQLRPSDRDLRAAAGREGDLDAWRRPRAPALWLIEIDGEHRRLPLGEILGAPIAADGGFRFDNVPAGDWRISLKYWIDVANRGGSSRELELVRLPGLTDGGVHWLDLDVAATQPGRVHGLVRFEGQPWRRGEARLGDVHVRTDDEGRFSAQLDPGRHWLELRRADDASRSLAFAEHPVEVSAAAVVEQVFDIRRRILRLRLLEADGTPATQRLFLLRGAISVDDPERDADGWITVDPIPPRPILVLTYPVGFDAAARAATTPEDRQQLVIRLGEVSVPEEPREARVELRIPQGK